MGSQGSKSKTKYESVLEAATEAVVRNINQCATQVKTDQNIVIIGNNSKFGDLKNRVAVQINGKCFQNTEATAKLQNDIAAAIEQSAAAQSITLTGVLGSSSASVRTSLYNTIRNQFTQESINQIINSINLKQNTVIVGSGLEVGNVENAIDQKIISNATQKTINDMDFMLKLKTDSQTSASAKQDDFLAGVIDSIFSGLTWSLAGPIVIIFFFVMIVVVIYLYFTGDKQESIGEIVRAVKSS